MTFSETIAASADKSETIHLADLEVDMGRQTVRRAGQRLPVKGRSFQLLQFLIERYPETAGHRELLSTVWSGLVVTPDALSQRIRLLRKALGDDNGDAGYVVSVHGQGYRLSVPPKRPEFSSPDKSPRPRITGKTALMALALAAICVVVVLVRYDAPHAIKHLFKHLLA
jgi:DNA-binding winged helix-turn-helix (wHTH) protein